jgi:hypothetical protein
MAYCQDPVRQCIDPRNVRLEMLDIGLRFLDLILLITSFVTV